MLFVDDLDEFDDPILERSGSDCSNGAVRIVATPWTLGRCRGTRPAAPSTRCGAPVASLVLRPDDPTDFLQLAGVKLRLRPGLRLVPGRGVLLVDRGPTTVQVVDA
ncbi:MAG: hypothetical protein R2697_00750 [Ilumatobacteraceae bacterium]